METEIQKLLDALTDLRKRAHVDAVFGKPVIADGRTVIPVAEVAYDFEMGIEEEAVEGGAEGGSGGSGGMSVRPVAVVEVTPEGTVVKSVVDEQKLALAGALLIGWAVFWVVRALVRIFGKQG
ncbi:MAG: hypothetical protein JW918_04530 [Anaerolineae bacterium]|nr:hypothetical protein [Anaerolineae bacterium]